MPFQYRTLATTGESLYKAKGSKHFGYAYRVSDEGSIGEILGAIRSAHPQANHVCYAWRLGADGEQYRSNDDGEPNNSAGKPILGQIEKHQLTHVLVAVVRYFGGTKLGVGGLIEAYRTAAEMAIYDAEITEVQLMSHFEIAFDYPDMSSLMLAIRSNHWESYDPKFETSCSIKLMTLPGGEEEISAVLAAFPSIRINFLGTY